VRSRAPEGEECKDAMAARVRISRILFTAPKNGSDHSSEQSTRNPIRLLGRSDTGRVSSSLFDLAPEGVCHAAALSRLPGGLLHHLFTLTRRERRAVCFLWHFPSAPIWRRLSGLDGRTSCPAESGLSSPAEAGATGHSPCSHRKTKLQTAPISKKKGTPSSRVPSASSCTGCARTFDKALCPGCGAPSVPPRAVEPNGTRCRRSRAANSQPRATAWCANARNTA